MTERGRGGEAGLARMDVASVFRGKATQVQELNVDTGRRGKYLAGNLDKAIRLRHFTGTGVLAAGRGVDQEDGRPAPIGMAGVRRADRGPRRESILRQIIVGIGEFRAGLAGARALAMMRIGIPGRRGHPIELRAERGIGRVLELIEKALAEFALLQARARHSLAW